MLLFCFKIYYNVLSSKIRLIFVYQKKILYYEKGDIFLMKNTIILNGVYDNFLELKKTFYLSRESYNDKTIYYDYLKPNEVDECFRIYNATRQRKRNNWIELCKWCYAIEFISQFKDKQLIFGTLTFKDKVLSYTSERTRQRYITWYLKNNTIHYIANIDFGSKNNREHYHFIALVDKKLNCKDWKYGASKFQLVPLKKEDLKRTKNYLLKLNNHSYKNTTRQKRIIRDRNSDIIDNIINTIGSETFRKYKLKLDAY